MNQTGVVVHAFRLLRNPPRRRQITSYKNTTSSPATDSSQRPHASDLLLFFRIASIHQANNQLQKELVHDIAEPARGPSECRRYFVMKGYDPLNDWDAL